jgi:peptidoglycan/xylan/chitin deacetylase (PgdA/CDA1 family)
VSRATVIAYHAVSDCPPAADAEHIYVAPKLFERHMAFLARRRRVLPLESVVRGAVGPGRPAVAITFDDAFRSVLTEAAPILGRHGFPATVFVPTAWLGRRVTWYAPAGCEAEVMDEPDLRALEQLGVSVESHGHEHADLSRFDGEEARRDLKASADRLAEILGRPPRYVAYPWGRSSPAARDAARSAGFEAAFEVDSPADGRFALARVGVTRLDGRALYALKTSGLYPHLRRSRVARGAYTAARPVIRRRAR